MKIKFISNPIFCENLEVCYTEDFKEMNKQIKKYKIYDLVWDFESSAMYVRSEKLNMSFILLTDTQPNTIAHEVVHLVFNLLQRTWIPITSENDEVFAHLVDFYVREIILFLKLENTN